MSDSAHMASMTSSPVDIDALEATARAAEAIAPGPWFWRGNIDHADPQLSCIKPGFGRVEVLGTIPVDRDLDSERGRNMRSLLKDAGLRGEALESEMRAWALHDPYEDDPEMQNPKTDDRLSFFDGHAKEDAASVATLEVARNRGLPDNTPRSDPRIYRGDIVDVRNPLAQHMAAADPSTVLALIEQIRELQSLIDTGKLS